MTGNARRALDRIEESELVELTQRLVRAAGQNPPSHRADESVGVAELVVAAHAWGVSVDYYC